MCNLSSQEAGKFIERLVPPVLSCFNDQDSRVRYYACEALYNVAKVSRRAILPYFTRIFDDISKVCGDLALQISCMNMGQMVVIFAC